MAYDTLVALIRAWECFEGEHSRSASLAEFGRWLISQEARATTPERRSDYEHLAPEVLLNILIHRLDRRWELLVKPIFAASDAINSLTELRVLACVHGKGQPKKHEVVADVLLENATGAMLIRRLVERGLLTEKPDPHDRRAVRLNLTPVGHEALETTRRQLWPLMREFFAPLDAAEQRQLLVLLDALEPTSPQV